MHGLSRRGSAGVLTVLALLIAALSACGGGDDEDTEPTPTSVATIFTIAPDTPTPVLSVTGTPPRPTPERVPRPSGDELIDAVIGAVESQDADALAGLLHFFLIGCTDGQGIGAIPCPAGLPAGTPVEAIGVGGCEDSFLLKGATELASTLERFVSEPPARDLYAVAITPPFPGDERVPGHFMIIWRHGQTGIGGSTASAVSVDQEGVTYLHFGCGSATTPESFTRGSTDFLIPAE